MIFQNSREKGELVVNHLMLSTLPQFSSVAQLCPTLCDPCSTPGFRVHHQLPELAQTHIHWVGDAIQPSHSPPALNLFQHQGLLQWVSSSHQVAKYWSFSFRISPSNEYSRHGVNTTYTSWLRQRTWFDPWVGKIPRRREWLPTPALLPGEFHGQRRLAGYNPWGHEELDTTEQLTLNTHNPCWRGMCSSRNW